MFTARGEGFHIPGIVALFGCGIAGILLVSNLPDRVSKPPIGMPVVEGESVETPADTIPPANMEAIISFCASCTTASRGFVVFANGTCVLVKEPSADPGAEAKLLLAESAAPEARFLKEKTLEGDIVVTFQDTVFHWVPSADVANLDVSSLEHLGSLLSQSELESTPEGWMPAADARVGLVARKRLNADAQEGRIVKILRPHTAVAGYIGEGR